MKNRVMATIGDILETPYAGRARVNSLTLVKREDPGSGLYLLTSVNRAAGYRPAAFTNAAAISSHHERFAYFRLACEQGLDEMADFIAAFAGAQ